MNRKKKTLTHSRMIIAVASAILIGLSNTLYASDEKLNIDIKSQGAGIALVALGEHAGVQITVPQDVASSITLNSVIGQYTLSEALDQMLDGTGLVYKFVSDDSVIIQTVEISTKKSGSATIDKDAQLLEEMIVTAQKREQRLLDVPMSILAIGAKDIEERGILNFEDLGMAAPSLTINDSGDGFGRRIFMRGIGNLSGSSSLIGVYMDEIPLTTNPLWQFDVRAYDLERIEVLRGPQGTLYGQGSSGGTVRFITKRPELDRSGFKADVSTSYTQDGDPSQRIQSTVNLPLIEDELAVRVTGIISHAGGWVDQPAASEDNINDETLSDVRVKTLWRPSENFELDFMANIRRTDRGSSGIGEDENGDFTQVFGVLETPSSDDDFEVYNLTANYDAGAVNLLSSTSYINTEKVVLGVGGRFMILPAPAPLFEDLLDSFVQTDVFSEEIRLDSNTEGPWQWSVGLFYQDGEFDRTSAESFGLPPGPPPPPFVSTSTETSKSWAIFGNTSFQLTDWLEVGGGLRYFEDERSLVSTLSTEEQNETFDSVSPRIYANIDLTENVMFYTSIAKGFRSGGFNLTPGVAPFEPEDVWTYEVGTKTSLNNFTGEFSVFYSEYSDYQIFGIPAPPAPPIGSTSNAGDAEIKGVELGMTFQVTENLDFSFNANYLDTEFADIRVTGGSHITGDPVDFVAKYQFTASSTYDFYFHDKPGYVRLDYNQKGRSTFSSRGIFVIRNPSGVINMLNFRLGWNWSDNLSFALFATNLLNDRDYTTPWSAIDAASRSRPRSIGIEMGVDF